MVKLKIIKNDELIEIGTKTGFNLSLLEKDYYLTILLYLMKDIEGIYFKGGTALQKTILDYSRISENIDFTLTRNVEEVKNEITKILEESKLFTGITQDKTLTLFTRMVIKYEGINKDEIYIDLNKKGKLLNKPEKILMKQFYKKNIPEFSINCLAMEEMVAEKVSAAIGRNKPRDHYDIYQIIKHKQKINMELVKQKCKLSGSDPSIIKMFNKAKKLHNKWDDDILPLLAKEITFKEVIKTLANYFNLKEEKDKLKV